MMTFPGQDGDRLIPNLDQILESDTTRTTGLTLKDVASLRQTDYQSYPPGIC